MWKFSIRDLLWLMIAVGLAFALWSEHQAAIGARRERDALFDVLSRMRTLLETDDLETISDAISRHEHEVGPN
jgi:hypothetical protein